MFVMGTPAPQGSKKGFARNGRVMMVESSKKVGPWREAVVAQCQRDGLAGRMMTGPVSVDLLFLLPRPKGHYGTGRNADVLKPGSPKYPTGKPDTDKLARAVMDALVQAGVLKDDSQVVALDARKAYCSAGDPVPGAHVTVGRQT